MYNNYLYRREFLGGRCTALRSIATEGKSVAFGFTRQGSLVQSQYRPPNNLLFIKQLSNFAEPETHSFLLGGESQGEINRRQLPCCCSVTLSA